jgi:hypothetical protein
VHLRASYGFEAIAGSGSEIDRMIRLMNWVHTTVLYDGAKGNTKTGNSHDLLELSANGDALNCRGLAIILNDVYLTMGFRSRYLYCMPRDTQDHECHVITIVYSDSLRKWLWMDPTNNAYIMNTEGVLLSPDEVRSTLQNGIPLRVNEDANVNGHTRRTAEDYIYGYLAKNLYWFETPLSSEYDYESRAPGKKIDYVRLYPNGYSPFGKGDMIYSFGTSYVTTSANFFWQAPK